MDSILRRVCKNVQTDISKIGRIFNFHVTKNGQTFYGEFGDFIRAFNYFMPFPLPPDHNSLVLTTPQSFDTYIAPTMSLADIVIPQGAENVVALHLITQHVKRELDR